MTELGGAHALADLLFVPAGSHFGDGAPVGGPPLADAADGADPASVYPAVARWITGRRSAAGGPTPFMVGVAGGVAAGKTTTAERLAALLRAGPGHPEVVVVSADGFLYPNAELAARGLTARKGFPESFDTPALVWALATLKAGRPADIPGYSHTTYDVAPGGPVGPADLVVVEGINVLEVPPGAAGAIPSDLIDVAIYLDADEADLRRWFVGRLSELVGQARGDAASFYHQWAAWSDDEVARFAGAVWEGINLPNLREHIAPSRLRADLILQHGADHAIRRVLVRRP
jgi:type I pantothenate kinase